MFKQQQNVFMSHFTRKYEALGVTLILSNANNRSFFENIVCTKYNFIISEKFSVKKMSTQEISFISESEN